jgi:hypothetical protein
MILYGNSRCYCSLQKHPYMRMTVEQLWIIHAVMMAKVNFSCLVFPWEGKEHYSYWRKVKYCCLLPVREMEGGNNQVARPHSWLVGSEAWLTGRIAINDQGARPDVQLPWMVKLAMDKHRTVLQLWQFLQTGNITQYSWLGLCPTLNLCFLFHYSFILKWQITWCSTGPCF